MLLAANAMKLVTVEIHGINIVIGLAMIMQTATTNKITLKIGGYRLDISYFLSFTNSLVFATQRCIVRAKAL